VLKRQYWQIVVNIFFTYEKEKYVKYVWYVSSNIDFRKMSFQWLENSI